MTQFIDFIDTTLRDGQQSPLLFDTQKYRFNSEQKMQIVNGLIALGVRHIELFAPVVSSIEAQDTQLIMESIRAYSKRKKIKLLAHCRLHEGDIKSAIEAGFDWLHLYIGTSAYAKKSSHKLSQKEIISQARSILKQVRAANPNLYLRMSAEDAFRTPMKQIVQLYDEVTEYVDTLGAPDTVGIATPDLVTKIIGQLVKEYPKNKIECHFHNDRGLAVANALWAVKAGAHFIDTSVWGLAERSGIPSITAMLFNLVLENPELMKRYDTNQAYPLNVMMGSLLGIQVPYSEPISLTNRTHTAGVHQKAVINNAKVYEAHSLANWGVHKNQLLLGPLSGWNLIFYYLKEMGNFVVTPDQAKEITKVFKSRCARLKANFNPEDLLFTIAENFALVRQVVPKAESNRRIEVLDYHIKRQS